MEGYRPMQGDDGGINLAQRYAMQAQEEANRQFAPAMQKFQAEHGQYNAGEPDQNLGEEYSDRGAVWSDLLSCLTTPLLRLGLLTQLLVLASGFALFYGHGGRGLFSFDLFSISESLRSNASYTSTEVILVAAYAVGTFCVACFQIYVADNSKLSRGFRTGSKLLSTAAMLDVFVVALRLMQSIYAQKFLATRWWNKYNQSNADWVLVYAATMLHALCLTLYGLALFYMESYHDEGTYEEWSWILLILFSAAGFTEFIYALTGFGAFYAVLHLIALGAALIWAFSFEPLLHYYSPTFHDRDIAADVDIDDDDEEEPMGPK